MIKGLHKRWRRTRLNTSRLHRGSKRFQVGAWLRGVYEDFENYGAGAEVNGLNGLPVIPLWPFNGGLDLVWGGAFVDKAAYAQVTDDMESYTNGATVNGLNGGSSGWGGAYTVV